MPADRNSVKKVIVVGAGFAGIEVCKKLVNCPHCELVLVDRNNYHLFQPLLYQVAMAGLNPADIAVPIRKLFNRARNMTIEMSEVRQIDLEGSRILYDDNWHHYDYLVLACGAQHYYFGNDDWEQHAPGLKSLEQATEIRRRILTAFEMAEKTEDPDLRSAWLTFVVVGGGPTGVELAGAIAEMASKTLKRDYRRADLSRTQVILVEAGERLLSGFPESLSRQTLIYLEQMGVEVRLNCSASDVAETSIVLGGSPIKAMTKVWAAGVRGTKLADSIKVNKNRSGQLHVSSDMSLPSYRQVFVAGDMSFQLDQQGRPLAGVAPVAMQQGAFIGRLIRGELRGKPRNHFRYFDKGMMATIGRSKAVVSSHGIRLTGFLAWLIWALVHILFLIEFKNRFFVFLQWAWAYFSFGRGARLILRKDWRLYDQPNSDHLNRTNPIQTTEKQTAPAQSPDKTEN